MRARHDQSHIDDLSNITLGVQYLCADSGLREAITCLLLLLRTAVVLGFSLTTHEEQDELLLQIHGRAYPDAPGTCCVSDDMLVQELFT